MIVIGGLAMKRYYFAMMFVLVFFTNTFCFRNFIEKIDYFVEFHEKSPGMASVLHVNFIIIPESKDAESIVKQQLRIYGNATTVNGIKHKNIIGSAWYATNKKNLTKIKFQEDLAAYVWLGKTKTIVTFHNYMAFLKKEKINKI
jgi:hypothetical protein